MKDIALDTVPAARFLELVRSPFQVIAGDGPAAALELIAVSSPRLVGPMGHETFSLLFEGPRAPALGQGTFRFSHEQLGRFDLFIVPVGTDRATCQYEAVFNRPRPRTSPPGSEGDVPPQR